MEVKVLTTEPVIEIDGVKYHHHPNGGGLVAETAKVAETAYVGLFIRVVETAIVGGEACIKDRREACFNSLSADGGGWAVGGKW